VYVTRPEAAGRPAERFLAGFARVEVPAGERRAVRVVVQPERLAVRNGPGDWRVLPGRYRVDVGAHAADDEGTAIELDLP
jgi:beta-glucosidase